MRGIDVLKAMGKRAWAATAAAAAAAVLIVAGVVAGPRVAQAYLELTADPCQPDDIRLIEAEAVHQQPPPSAAPTGPASVQQPCEARTTASPRAPIELSTPAR